MKKQFILFFIVFACTALAAAPLNLVVFSYNRPLQLYAFLESFQRLAKGCQRISVVFKADSPEFKQGYKIVKEQFPNVEFLKAIEQKKV